MILLRSVELIQLHDKIMIQLPSKGMVKLCYEGGNSDA